MLFTDETWFPQKIFSAGLFPPLFILSVAALLLLIDGIKIRVLFFKSVSSLLTLFSSPYSHSCKIGKYGQNELSFCWYCICEYSAVFPSGLDPWHLACRRCIDRKLPFFLQKEYLPVPVDCTMEVWVFPKGRVMKMQIFK
jgi:hypothetical protein